MQTRCYKRQGGSEVENIPIDARARTHKMLHYNYCIAFDHFNLNNSAIRTHTLVRTGMALSIHLS